jgi:hypothetical protein
MPLDMRMEAGSAQLVRQTNACLKSTTGIVVELDIEQRWPAINTGSFTGDNEGTLLAAEEARSKKQKANHRGP